MVECFDGGAEVVWSIGEDRQHVAAFYRNGVLHHLLVRAVLEASLLAVVEAGDDVTDEGVDISATVRTADRTGIEMEALTAVSVAALALIDMVKAVDKHARITDVRVTAKSGGRSGDWVEP